MTVVNPPQSQFAMAKSEFLKILSDVLYPSLREEGFRGSGSTLRRVREPLIHVFNVQGSSNAKGCYINLGVHLAFLETVSGRGLTDIREVDCAFRMRLSPSDPGALRWPYGLSHLDGVKTAKAIAEAWSTKGQEFFSQYESYPDSFREIVANTDVANERPLELFTVAQIAIHLGLSDRALELAEGALPKVPPMATSLRGRLKRLHRELTEGQNTEKS